MVLYNIMTTFEKLLAGLVILAIIVLFVLIWSGTIYVAINH